MLKKIAALAAVVAVLPLGVGVISSPVIANAATKNKITYLPAKVTKPGKKTSHVYTLTGSKNIKKNFHIKSGSPALYKGKFAADKAQVTLTKIGSLKVRKTYKATQQITVKQNKKNVKYVYVTNGETKGWTLASKLTAGKFMPAD